MLCAAPYVSLPRMNYVLFAMPYTKGIADPPVMAVIASYTITAIGPESSILGNAMEYSLLENPVRIGS